MNPSPEISIGISTCPNDTFAFAALLEKRVAAPNLNFVLDDVEALNLALLAGSLQVSKASFHAALHLAGDYVVLPVGAAMGFGVGPLLLSAPHISEGQRPGKGHRVLCPGQWTTACLLYRLFCPLGEEPRQVVFSEIIPALASGEADFGVVIHEGRFTYQQFGLKNVADLGTLWEEEARCPLPLGGLLARKDLGSELIRAVTVAIRRSLAAARQDPKSALIQMKKYAQELQEEVLWEHIRLYVNETTSALGEEGRRALKELDLKARGLGIHRGPVLEIFEME